MIKNKIIVRNVFAVIVFLSVLVTGCASNSGEDIPELSLEHRGMPVPQVMEYTIGPSDMLSISVWNQEVMTRTVTVRPDGIIAYPLVGEMYVAGLTPSQLQEGLELELSEYVNVLEGEVLVNIDEVHSYRISVLGRVNTPGRFEFQSQATVLDALAEAGGLTDFAASSEILILRPSTPALRRIRFDYKDVLQSDENDGLLFVFPGDIILVP